MNVPLRLPNAGKSIAELGGLRLARIDHDQLAAAFAELLRRPPRASQIRQNAVCELGT
jgi:hypothetical protein